ncbi:MAG: response regulator [Elusimicrobiaceae bacterium]|nr:response regulator [Elusimicrobiaceae bacterium]
MRKRILIVEDETSIVELLSIVLSKEGYQVRACQNGRDAVSTMKSFFPHLVILDVMLPGLDGPSIIKIMSEDESLESIPVVVTSALVESEQMFKPYPQVKGFCPKPFVLAEFIAQVKKFIGD